MPLGDARRRAGGDSGRLFRSLLPAGVLVAEMDPACADPADLHPDERAQIANAVPRRQREFAAGRLLVRSLLPRLGVNGVPLLNDGDRVPLWPSALHGSITHCEDWCAAALMPASQGDGLGIDVEPARPLPEGVAARVLTAGEQEAISELPTPLRPHAERLVFCAKEAAYKALFPRTRRFLDFPELHVALDAHGGFVVMPAHESTGFAAALIGRYRIADGYLATAVVLPPNTLS